MIVYRMFATEYNHRECVRIFKPSQLVNVKQFMRKYCLESECGTTVELIKYEDGTAVKCLYRVRKP